MHFTSNGYGRKNGYRFEIRYSGWRDGEKMDKPYYLFIERPATQNNERMFTYTEHSVRFLTEDAAKAFCELIAVGKTSLEDIIAAEKKALVDRDAKYQEKAHHQVDAFFDKMSELGVDPVLVPEIVKEYLKLDLGYDERASTYFNQRLEESKSAPKVPAEPHKMTFQEYIAVYQNDMDVCLVDKDTGEHILPAICYLDEEEQADSEYGYDSWEKWVLSLPLDKVVKNNGCEMAVVNTEFTWDETCFLICHEEFESIQWKDIYIRSDWAGADFQARLEYLTEGKSFERPFDGTCMDSLNLEEQLKLCELLADHNDVFITTYPDNEEQYYAYTYHLHHASNRPIYDDNEVDIKLTAPGKGLTSTLQGKVYWAQHLGNKAKTEALKQSAPVKEAEQEM